MKPNFQYFFKGYVVFGVLIILLVGLSLMWFVDKNIKEFRHYHMSIAQESSAGVAQQVAYFIREQNRLVTLFASEKLSLILAVKNNPNDEDLFNQLANAIQKFFPNHFAFTISNSKGEPLFENFDGLISEACERDLKHFSIENKYSPYIHPNSEGYHFDVMANFGQSDKGILFISFHADIMGDILKSAQVKDHQIMLIYPKRKHLIEVVAEGARSHLKRDDYRLTDNEKSRILVQTPIPGTRWSSADLHLPNLFKDHYSKMVSIASIIIFTALSLVIFFIFRLIREEKQRILVEIQKNEMVSLVAHEFRTPITGIIGALGIILKKYRDSLDEKLLKMLTIADSSSKRLNNLVDDFLEIQTLSSGNFSVNIARIELDKFISEIFDFNSAYAEKFNVKLILENDISELENIQILADINRAHQVLSNLLSNAVKYGGEKKSVKISIEATKNKVKISVQDQGSGIPKKFQSSIFEQFTMANNQKVSGIKSTGLGLYVCKKIMDKHNGTIAFDSKPNQGTCFYVVFPRSIEG